MKIIFRPFTDLTGINGIVPKPAAKFIPNWFQKLPKFINNEKHFKLYRNNTTNHTVKACIPMLDSFLTGYMICLESDILVTSSDVGPVIASGGHGNISVEAHNSDQIGWEAMPDGYAPTAFKFMSQWSVTTPKGYSALFTHPLNRPDLPFYTLSGVVDVDSHEVPVSFPFFLKDGFEGIIPSGTPIAQIIPIKRDSWEHEIKEYDEKYIKAAGMKFYSRIYRAYKNISWARKDYR